MAIKLDSIKNDLQREAEGEPVAIPDLPDVTLKVRSFNYGPYKAAHSIVIKRLARRYGREVVPDDVLAREFGRLYADHILVGWDGFDVPYSHEVALAHLTDPAHRRLREHVEYAAARVGEREIEFLEDAAKN